MRVFALVCACVFYALPAAADPNDYSRIVSFGDSLSDNGNLANNIPPDLTKAPFAPGYFGGRFSNGPTWIEILTDPNNPATSMNRFWSGPTGGLMPPYTIDGNVNAAIGGAETIPGHPLLPPDTPPSVQDEIGAFLASGGVFGPNDLVSIQGGANDFFDFSKNPTGSPVDFANETADNEASNIALAISPSDFGFNSPGAKTILVSNLPNLGATPGSNGDPATAQNGLGLTVIYNTELNQKTEELAAAHPDVNLVQMDWFAALNVVIANPAAFGFTNVTDACILTQSCAAAAKDVQNQYLFWDTVHPTEGGHKLLEEYAALLLSTEETGKAVGALGQVALTTRFEASDIIFRRGVSPFREGPGGLYAEIIGETGSVDGSQTVLGSTGFDFSAAGLRAGFDASDGPISFGSSLTYQAGDISGHLLKSDLRSTEIDAYALTRLNALFAGVEAGVSFNDYTGIKRATGFPTVTADGGTESIDYTVAATLGAQYQLNGVTVTPAMRAGYASLNLDGYTESAPILALQYGDRDVTTGFWTARLRASAPFFGFGHAIAYGEVGYEDLFSTDDSYTAKLAFNTAHAVTINDDLEARGLYFKAGVGGYIDNNIKLTGEYSLSLQNGNGEVQSGRVRVTIPLYSDASLGLGD